MLIKTLLLIGLPVGLQFGMMGGVRMVVLRLTADYGTNVLAAAGIGFRILLMAVLPVVAIGIATTTLVGQNIGARKLERSQKSGFLSIVIAMGAMGFLGLLTALLAKPLMGIFTEDLEVITYGVDFLRIVSLSLFFIGAAIAANGVFRGAGDTTPPMIISFVKLILLIAFAFILPKSLELGVRGLWWSMVIVYVIESILIGIWFSLGRWKKRRVEEIEIPKKEG
jgi:Na+-driven multidrug efflux pump